MNLCSLSLMLLMQCRDLVSVSNVELMSVNVKDEMDSKSKGRVFGTRFPSRSAKVFVPEA